MSNSNSLEVNATLSYEDCMVLDRDFLNENTFHDASLRQEIMELFFKQLSEVEISLRKPMDAKAWRYMAHTLKGAAAAVGAQQISRLALDWEMAGLPANSQALATRQLSFARALAAFESAAGK